MIPVDTLDFRVAITTTEQLHKYQRAVSEIEGLRAGFKQSLIDTQTAHLARCAELAKKPESNIKLPFRYRINHYVSGWGCCSMVIAMIFSMFGFGTVEYFLPVLISGALMATLWPDRNEK